MTTPETSGPGWAGPDEHDLIIPRSELLTRQEYDDWLTAIDFDPTRIEDRAARTLLAHVLALRARVEQLIDPWEHDKQHGTDCRCWLTQCACAYDHPDAACSTHGRGVMTGPLSPAPKAPQSPTTIPAPDQGDQA